MGFTFAAVAVLFAILATTVVISLVSFVNAGNDVVSRWEPAATVSQDLYADLLNQETGVRGYVLSGRIEFLDPYAQAIIQQTADTTRLHELLAGHAGLLADLQAFDAAVSTWHDQTAARLIALVQAGDPLVRDQVDSTADMGRFDAVRRAVTNLIDHVNSARNVAGSHRRQAATALVIALAVTALLILAGALLIWRGLHRWVLGPVDRLAGQTRDVADGDLLRVIAPYGPPEFLELGNDVETMRCRITDELESIERTRQELIRSNDDLEQFAYVASHDLSEPLRKVANFCQLLERQYADELDDKAKQYIAFAVDGAKRMQALITDLLSLSRVGRRADAFTDVDTGQALTRALANLESRIAASGGGVGHSDLPVVKGDQSLLTSLFANLVGNAIKYRGEDPPLVVVTAIGDNDTWTFTVKDNGIGIESQYAERIFAIFQRLHVRDEYEGTGIGLAMCRKIVEYHGGRIWLDTSARSGATFRFTLPKDGPLDL
ncbi:MAG: ATP-binding protein [Jatrophihabitantaceae bacterium]